MRFFAAQLHTTELCNKSHHEVQTPPSLLSQVQILVILVFPVTDLPRPKLKFQHSTNLLHINKLVALTKEKSFRMEHLIELPITYKCFY